MEASFLVGILLEVVAFPVNILEEVTYLVDSLVASYLAVSFYQAILVVHSSSSSSSFLAYHFVLVGLVSLANLVALASLVTLVFVALLACSVIFRQPEIEVADWRKSVALRQWMMHTPFL